MMTNRQFFETLTTKTLRVIHKCLMEDCGADSSGLNNTTVDILKASTEILIVIASRDMKVNHGNG